MKLFFFLEMIWFLAAEQCEDWCANFSVKFVCATAYFFQPQMYSIVMLVLKMILKGLVHLIIWKKPFIIFNENLKISTDQISNSANHDQIA
jgi:hypothetical protein